MASMSNCALKIVSAALLCAGLLAQDEPSPTFRTNTNLVIVNVAIKDKSGKPIEDLKKDQFTLLEDGKPQQIAVFELQRLNGDILPPLEIVTPTLKTRGAAVEPPPVKVEPLKTDQLKDR